MIFGIMRLKESMGAIISADVICPAGNSYVVAFMAGHSPSDFGWFSLVAVGSSRGRSLLSVRQYRIVLAAGGVFILIFGVLYFFKMVLGW